MAEKVKIKTVIYIHGYKSTGGTGELLKGLLKGKYEVIAPKIPQDAKAAHELIKKLCEENKESILVGSSLGAFDVLTMGSKLKIVINPTLHPSESLPIIGCPKEIADTYKYFEDQLEYYRDGEDAVSTYGFFGTKDRVVNYRAEFEDKYLKSQTFSIPNGVHRIRKEELIKYVIPLIDKLSKKPADPAYDYIDTLYIPED